MKVALIGNPSVGKSLIFNQLTGVGVEVSNYPGTTVELKGGSTCYQREMIDIVDLPGIYSLDGTSEEEDLVRTFLQEGKVDAVIVVMDATRLERNLYLLLQVAEFGIPMIAVLNMIDEMEKEGLEIDTATLEYQLGIEVVETAASKGHNIEKIVPLVRSGARKATLTIPYDRSVEAAVRTLEKTLGAGRTESLWALQGIAKDGTVSEAASAITEQIEARHRMTVQQIIAANRHNYARTIAERVIKTREAKPGFDLDQLLTSSIPGIPILVMVLLSTLLVVFIVGAFLEETIVDAFQVMLIDPLLAFGLPPLAENIALSLAIALQAGLGIAFPFVFIFYILLSILEDTGYMTRAAFLADKAMHRVGMHGGAIIPLVLGLGCNVPAVMGLRNLASRREKIIGAFLITMVPCSARTVIILGIVAAFVGILPALTIYLIVFLLITATGLLLSRVTPGEQFGMILEMAPLRRPQGRLVFKKSWLRMKEFLFIAMPMLLVGSIFLGLFEYIGITAMFEKLIAPFSEGVLGVPPYAATALLFGILRKEMAFEMLAILGGTANLSAIMTSLQLYIFGLVSVLFVPCVSTIAVLLREMGARITAAVTLYTVGLGIIIGALINLIFG
ncbi:MAG TPA: ferrous iron transport protein B [Methanoculleus sp.]|nr:ferrous iron transport protein B [Methanoculleus sp.]